MTENVSFTLKGLRIVIFFYLLSIIMTVTNSIFNYSFKNPTGAFITGIIGLLTLIIIAYGIRLVLKEKKDFGPSHEKSTTKAGKFILVGILFFLFLSFFVIPFVALSVADYLSDFGISIMVAAGYTVIMVPFWLAMVYLIKELAEENIRKLLWFAFYFHIIIFFITRCIVFESFGISPNLYVLVQLFSIIPSLLVAFCYYKTYLRIKEKQIMV